MSAPELAWRARGALGACGERFLARFGFADGKLPLGRVTDLAQTGEAMLFGPRPPAFLLGDEESRVELIRALTNTPAGGTRGPVPGAAFAEEGLAPGIRALPSEWNRDPATGRLFPLLHWSEIDYRRPADEEAIRRLWYLARHRQVPEMALPYFLGGERPAAVATAEGIRSWIAQCPPYRGIHWLVPLELALRLINWSYAARLLKGSEALAALAPELARSVHLQAEHVRSHLSQHSSANNHLIGQAAGLVHAGVGFAGLRRAELWRNTGCVILWREIMRQTTEDGVSREASTHYHEFVLELGLLVWLLLRANGEEPPAAVRTRLEAMLDFLAELDAFPGGPPELGDSDGQSTLVFDDDAPSRRTLLALGAVLCQRGEWKAQVGSLTRRAILLLGERDRAEFASLAAERSAPTSRVYPAAGLALLREAGGDRSLLFDCGELGYLATAAHAHADCLSIVLGASGESLLVDPGTYTYHARPALRDFFRSTAAHNTVRVDGEDQSEMRGPFLWGERAHGRLVEWMSWEAIDVVTGEHDGYRRLKSPVAHRRTLVFVKPDYLWVVDELGGAGEHLVEQFLHFGAAAAVSRGARPGEVIAHTGSGPVLRILVLGELDPEIELLRGSERPLQGWVSPRFGEREPGVVWRRVAWRSTPAVLHLLLRPLGATAGRAAAGAAAGAAGVEPVTPAAVATLESGHALHAWGMPGEDLVCLARAGEKVVRGMVPGGGALAGEVELEGRLALVRFGADGLETLAAEGLRRLKVGGEVLVEVEGDPASFCLRRFGDRALVEGNGGTVRIRGARIGTLRCGDAALAVERSGDWLRFHLAPRGA